jgi:non-ribosomal peptide synthetase component E (peptide arylation enzyme)
VRDVSGWEVRLNAAETQAFRASGAWRNRTIGADARDRAVSEPNRICLQDAYRSATFLQVLREAEALAKGLTQLGLKAGDVVSFQLPNWIEAAVINLAASLLGLVVNPIVPIYRESETTAILRDSGAKIFFVPDLFRRFDHLGMAKHIRTTTPSISLSSDPVLEPRPRG